MGSNVNYTDQLTQGGETPDEALNVVESEVVVAENPDLEESAETQSGLRSLLREVVETIILAVVIWLIVNGTTARYVVEGQSMEPNLHTGQFLIVSRLAYMHVADLFRLGAPQRGDIIVFDYPGNPSDDYVKRVIGLPGETVTIDDNGQVSVDGTPLAEPYLDKMAGVPYRGRTGSWTVPDNSYFVLGDNRNSSSDSRSWGMLEQQYIVGKAWVSYWPPQNWGVIPHFSYSTP